MKKNESEIMIRNNNHSTTILAIFGQTLVKNDSNWSKMIDKHWSDRGIGYNWWNRP